MRVKGNNVLSMNADQVAAKLHERQPHHLPPWAAIGYVAHILLGGPEYAAAMRDRCPTDFPGAVVSDSLLYESALTWWVRQGGVERERMTPSGKKGAPRYSYSLKGEWREVAEKLAKAWIAYYKREVEHEYLCERSEKAGEGRSA